MKLATIGVDWAKNVFQVHGVDERGKAIKKKQMRRAELLPFCAGLTPLPHRLGLLTVHQTKGNPWARHSTTPSSRRMAR